MDDFELMYVLQIHVDSAMKAERISVDWTRRKYGQSLSSYLSTYTNFVATSNLNPSL
jgi:hypothetical protein